MVSVCLCDAVLAGSWTNSHRKKKCLQWGAVSDPGVNCQLSTLACWQSGLFQFRAVRENRKSPSSTHTHTHTHAQICICMHTHMDFNTQTHAYACKHTYTRTYM